MVLRHFPRSTGVVKVLHNKKRYVILVKKKGEQKPKKKKN